jgi:hypothetical protein
MKMTQVFIQRRRIGFEGSALGQVRVCVNGFGGAL